MKTTIITTRNFLLKLCSIALLLVAMQSCVSPIDVEDPNGKTIIEEPFVPAALFDPKNVELHLIQENSLQPNEDIGRPLWANDFQHRIQIDTNKVDGRKLPRLIVDFTATLKPNGARSRENQSYLLKQIRITLPDTIDLDNPDTIDLDNDDERIFLKKDLSPNNNFFVYQYLKTQKEVTVPFNDDARLIIRVSKQENRNRIVVNFNYVVFTLPNGVNVPNGDRQFGRGELIINY
jgi:hypothetical protein